MTRLADTLRPAGRRRLGVEDLCAGLVVTLAAVAVVACWLWLRVAECEREVRHLRTALRSVEARLGDLDGRVVDAHDAAEEALDAAHRDDVACTYRLVASRWSEDIQERLAVTCGAPLGCAVVLRGTGGLWTMASRRDP